MFFILPPQSVICRYSQVKPGVWAVVSVSGQVLASSFFELRKSFSFVGVLAGLGAWVAIAPIQAVAQPALFRF